MENEKKLSVVIPTYNIEKYINKCITSFIDNRIIGYLDIIVVNDGSTDNSFKIASEIAKKYPDSIKVISKENGGHGSTINTALKYACGKYFMVVDGDDWIDADALYNLFNDISDADYDIIFFNCVSEIVKNDTKRYKNLDKILNCVGEVDFSKVKVDVNSQINMSNIMYKTKILKESNLKIDEKTYYVDVEYMLYPIIYINNGYYSKQYIYHYLIGRNGQSINIKTAIKHIDDRKKVISSIVNYYSLLDKKNLSHYSLLNYYSKMASVINDYYDILIRADKHYYNKVIEFNDFIKSKDMDLFNFAVKEYRYLKYSNNKFILKPFFYIDRYYKKIKRVIIRRKQK